MKEKGIKIMKTNKEDNVNLGLKFDNTYIDLPDIFYTKKDPVSVNSPSLKVLNKSLAKSLGLDISALETNSGLSVFAGNFVPDGATPIAQAYAGHQFGHFTMLGDGRTILLGEHIPPGCERFDIQLKGSGRTKYSRGGDGRAAIGPMLREYIISEAMHSLGIPTTRSLAVVTTGEKVYRETALEGAILTRVASSHIRVGTFQYASIFGNKEELTALADYTIDRHFPEIASAKDKYLLLLRKVVENQARLISKWQLVGFIHGVMNTDNMTISGETIDYGPCAFMDSYKLSTVFSSIDTGGRYAYGNQPKIGIWNLSRFSETLLPLIDDNEDKAVELATKEVSRFSSIYNELWLDGMRKKLGLFNEEAKDKDLITDLLAMMEKNNADYTNTFRGLGQLDELDMFKTDEFTNWFDKWKKRLSKQSQSEHEVKYLMKTNNPAIIPRNHRVEEALTAAERGDFSVMDKLLKALENPYEYSKDQEEYTKLSSETSRPYQTFCGT